MMLLGSRLAPPWGGHKLEHRNKENQLQNSSSLKLKGLELWYLVLASPCKPLSILFIWFLWSQNWPHPEGHKLEPKEQRCRIQLWGKLLRWAIQGHHGPPVSSSNAFNFVIWQRVNYALDAPNFILCQSDLKLFEELVHSLNNFT